MLLSLINTSPSMNCLTGRSSEPVACVASASCYNGDRTCVLWICAGNVNTRLRKLDDGEFDAIVLASAGLIRLGMSDRIAARFPPELMLPACGQGIVGVECKVDDEVTNTALAPLHDKDTADRVACERSLNARLGGSCSTPIAAFSELKGEELYLRALVGMPDGSKVLEAEGSAARTDAVALGVTVAEQLFAAGADEIVSYFN